ncbi:MAG: ABC transporter ATP-binding protein [Caldisericota bacterium]|nr:ABC transporter ATP-binding protein [Caldisericota bacterium]
MNRKILKRFLPYILKYKLFLSVSFVMLFIATVSAAVLPYLLKQSIDEFVAAKDFLGLVRISALFLGISGIRFVSKMIQIYFTNLTGQRVMRDLRIDLFKHLESFAVSFFSREPSGKIITRITNDVENMNELLSAGVVALFGDFATLLFVIVFIFFINVKFALLVIIPLPIAIVSALFLGNKLERLYEKVRDYVVKMNIEMQENLSGIILVQAFNVEQRSRKKFGNIAAGYRRTFHIAQMTSIQLRQVINILSYISIAIVIIAGGIFTLKGAATIGTIMAFLVYVDYLYRPLRGIAEKFSILQNAIASMNKLNDFFEEKEIIKACKNPVQHEIRGDLVFKDVNFSYDKKTPTLRDINLQTKAGEKVALVGLTGAGKSTIANLVLRFYDADSGTVMVDKINVQRYDIRQLRSRMAMVLQHVFIFKGTVRDNITLGNHDITEEQLIAAAKKIGVHDFIMKFANGYDTELSTEGGNISQGERQLISFTRALVYNPRILLLDEATASIDTATEELIERGIKEIMEGRTSIVIAHRLSTIINSDRIYVINRGKVAEQGTHQELMKQKGLYFELYTTQFEKV